MTSTTSQCIHVLKNDFYHFSILKDKLFFESIQQIRPQDVSDKCSNVTESYNIWNSYPSDKSQSYFSNTSAELEDLDEHINISYTNFPNVHCFPNRQSNSLRVISIGNQATQKPLIATNVPPTSPVMGTTHYLSSSGYAATIVHTSTTSMLSSVPPSYLVREASDVLNYGDESQAEIVQLSPYYSSQQLQNS